MKKLFLIFILFLFSCNSDDSAPSPSRLSEKLSSDETAGIINNKIMVSIKPDEKYAVPRKILAKSSFVVIWPYSNLELTSPYGFRLHPVLHTVKYHRGLDFQRPLGSPVYAVAKGKVIEARYDLLFGNMVKVLHEGGMESLYAHLSEIMVLPGDEISEHTLIGLTGSTGRSTGPHLHLGIKAGGHSVDPLYFLGREFTSDDLKTEKIPWVYGWDNR